MSRIHRSVISHEKADYQRSDDGHERAVEKGKRRADRLPERASNQACWQSDSADDEVIRTECGGFEVPGGKIGHERSGHSVSKTVIESVKGKKDPDNECR